MLVGGNVYGSITPLYVVAEGCILLVLNNTNLINGLVSLLATYYVFNIKYPNKGKNIYSFLEATLLNNVTDARKRVTINKLLQELDVC
jgi:hypothetical protein